VMGRAAQAMRPRHLQVAGPHVAIVGRTLGGAPLLGPIIDDTPRGTRR
jgi:hypothetical protein